MRGMSSTLFFLALIFDRVQQVFAGKAAINSVSARSSGCWLMPISHRRTISCPLKVCISQVLYKVGPGGSGWDSIGDRKSTRLNSSHQIISYAVFCLKKKKNNTN